MALVAYDDSDSEDNGATEDDYRPAVVSKKTTTEKQTVKIGLPFSNLQSADSDDSDDETAPVVRRPRPAGAKSGLASFLPEPKAGKGKSVILVPPNVQSRIQAARNATKHKKANLSTSTQQVTTEKQSPDEGNESFFSYLDSKPTEEHIATVRVGPCMPQANSLSSLYHFESSSDATSTQQGTEGTQSGQQRAGRNVEDRLTEGLDVSNSSQLDPEVLRKLAGKKRKREDVKIVDISEGDVVQQMDLERLKKTSEESPNTGSGRGRGRGGVSGLHKKKHQITYLIHEAKEKELELKQQWAANKSNRRESRLKYGF